MTSRGSVASGGFEKQYITVGNIYDADILEGLKGHHSLPDYSGSPNAKYIKLNPDGSFHELRIYNENKKLVLEIGYHFDKKLSDNKYDRKVLHYHIYDENLNRSPGIKLSEDSEYYNKYSKYWEGLLK